MIYTKGREMRIFISGPITGTDDYIDRFLRAEIKLTEEGYTVVNPAGVLAQLPVTFSWGTCMAITLALLEECDSIYMLKGWEHSKGAQMEHTFAAGLGKEIVYEEKKAAAEADNKAACEADNPALQQEIFTPAS